ncbi:hypothetical protein [Galactobacter caseinivorans]|uniref:Uncharacterized protein n=1 Tax=Galactobacter caseinivorans TaxID=2676123 RepID=A0A496PKV3_9MICC|nr:hypothetical protein [Galactobacter caseinivorans]RKW71134.1 hypothetical protein DWQ67_04925 [Galactobacter caseinivorans]
MAWIAAALMVVATALSAPTLFAPHRVARGAARLIALGSVLLLGAAAVCAVVAAQHDEGLPVWWAQPLCVLAAISAGSSITMAVLSLTRMRAPGAAPTPGAAPGAAPAEEEESNQPADSAPGESRQATSDAADPGASLLRGGSLIGVFERAGVTSTLLAGWPEGLAVVLALKGLGRFPELKSSQGQGAAERFILGTSVSVLVAAACAGLAVLLTLHA